MNIDKNFVTKEMVYLYDDYTHGKISKRSFVSRLITLVGGVALANGIFSLL